METRLRAMGTRSRAIARDGVKTHFIFYSLRKRFPDNQMFMYKQRIKRLTIPPKEIFELTLTLHIRKTFIILFHFWSCFKLKSAETHRARWAQKQNNSPKMVTIFGTKRAMIIILFGDETSGNGESSTQNMFHENVFSLRSEFFSNLVPLFSKGL